MSITYGSIKQLSSQLLHATESIVYTAGTGSSEISSIWLHNVTGVPATVQAWWPFTATTPTASYSASISIERLSEAISGSVTLEIAPKVPFFLQGSSNDKITMRATQTSSITVVIYGREGSGIA